MAYARKRKFRKKRRFYRRKGGGFAKRVKGVLQSMAEKKVQTSTYSAAEIDWDGRMHSYNTITGGSGGTGRIGNTIQPKGIAYNFSIYSNSASNVNTVSLIWFRDNQQIADTNPTAGDILEDVGSTLSPNSHLSLDNRGRFTILRRITFTLTDAESGSNQRVIKGYLRLPKGKYIRYNSTASTDIERNGLYLLLISSGDPALNSCFVTGSQRMYYIDV